MQLQLKLLTVLVLCLANTCCIVCSDAQKIDIKDANTIEHIDNVLSALTTGCCYDCAEGKSLQAKDTNDNNNHIGQEATSPHVNNKNNQKDQNDGIQQIAKHECNNESKRFYSCDLGCLLSINIGNVRSGVSGGLECGAFFVIPFCGDSYSMSHDHGLPSFGAQSIVFTEKEVRGYDLKYNLISNGQDRYKKNQDIKKYPLILFKPVATLFAGALINMCIGRKFSIFVSGGYCLRWYRFYYNLVSQSETRYFLPPEIQLIDINRVNKLQHSCYFKLGCVIRIKDIDINMWFGMNFMNELLHKNNEFIICSNFCGGLSFLLHMQLRRRFYISIAPSVAIQVRNASSKVQVVYNKHKIT